MNVQAQPKLVSDKANGAWSFEYTTGEKWRSKWIRSKKKFEAIDDATRAAGLWMQISYDNNMPIAVRLVEV